jgi:predicted phage terminase large subunit-like protein
MEQQAAQEILERKSARTDLIGFTQYNNPDYRPCNVHNIIADKLSLVEQGKIKRLMLLIPPRHGKSTLTTLNFPAMYLARNARKQLITASYGGDLATDFSREIRNLVDSPEYQTLFPKMRLRKDSKAANRWHTTNGGIFIAAGVGGRITGKGAHLGVIDDPHKDRKEADSRTKSNDVWDWYRSTFYPRMMPGGAIVLAMQRWNEYDLAGRLIEKMKNGGEQWTIVCLPAMVNEKGEPSEFEDEDGTALWPEQYPIKELKAIRLVQGSRFWNSQYQQNPMPEDGDIIKCHWFNHWEKLPEKFNEIAQTWDLSFKDKDESSFVSGQVWGRIGADRYLLDEIHEKLGFTESIKEFLRMSKKWPMARRKLVEDKANGPALQSVLKHKVSGIIMIEPSGDKKERLWACQPAVEAGNVYLPSLERYPWVIEWINELVGFPNAARNDRVDAFTQIMNYWEVKQNRLFKVLSQR